MGGSADPIGAMDFDGPLDGSTDLWAAPPILWADPPSMGGSAVGSADPYGRFPPTPPTMGGSDCVGGSAGPPGGSADPLGRLRRRPEGPADLLGGSAADPMGGFADPIGSAVSAIPLSDPADPLGGLWGAPPTPGAVPPARWGSADRMGGLRGPFWEADDPGRLRRPPVRLRGPSCAVAGLRCCSSARARVGLTCFT